MSTSKRYHRKRTIRLSSFDLTFHGDILSQILLRLPIRSLTRFKSVSKHWRSLISNPQFLRLRKPDPNSPSGLVIRRSSINLNAPPKYDFVPFEPTLDFDPNMMHLGMVIHSCGGLFLCNRMPGCNDQTFKKVYDDKFYVCNPATNEFITLPKYVDCNIIERSPCGMTLDFDPLISPHYKVICVRERSDGNYRIEVYSSEYGRWEVLCNNVRIPIFTEFMSAVYWNDTIHWINRKRIVVYYNINENLVNKIPTPYVHRDWDVKRHCPPLVKSRDSLMFISVFPTKVVVYEMNKDYSEWSKIYNVDISSITYEYPNMSPSYLHARLPDSLVVHCLVLGEEEEDAFLVVEICGSAIRYNLESETCQKLCDFESSRFFKVSQPYVDPWPGAFLFIQSLCHVGQKHHT